MEEKEKKKRSKKIWIPIVVSVLLAVLFIPVPSGVYKDGGTRAYTALTYKIVKWNRLDGLIRVRKTEVYWFPNNFKSIDTLWEAEQPEDESFEATVVEINPGVNVLVEPLEGEVERRSSDRIRFSVNRIGGLDVEPGDIVEVFYDGTIQESYPAKIYASEWYFSEKNRERAYTGQWIDKSVAEGDNNIVFNFTDLQITKIYTDCFFARPLPLGQAIKLNGTLSDEWGIGDQVYCTYENACYDAETGRMEADLLTIKAGDWRPETDEFGEIRCYKPVIYLYPEEETEVSVKLDLNGKLICTYPAYNDGWSVTALPDGTLTDAKGQTYNYLYWEGETEMNYDFSEGFCVKGEDTAAFLDEALEKLGLTRQEANEFIVYWLPMMEQNTYNLISFQTENYTEAARLAVEPAPDTLLRVFMAWKAADDFVELPKQELTASERIGFTVVEWGGTEVENKGFPDWGLTLSVKDVTPTGLTLVYGQKEGNPTGQILWGEDYRLLVQEDGTWKDVPMVVENAIWNGIAYGFAGDEDLEATISWEWLYGKLPAGTYRLEKEFMDFRGTADYDTAMYWVGFEIEE